MSAAAANWCRPARGTTILAANNTYTGTTTIAAGTLQVGNGGTLGSLGTGAVVNAGVLRFNRSNTLTVGERDQRRRPHSPGRSRARRS